MKLTDSQQAIYNLARSIVDSKNAQDQGLNGWIVDPNCVAVDGNNIDIHTLSPDGTPMYNAQTSDDISGENLTPGGTYDFQYTTDRPDRLPATSIKLGGVNVDLSTTTTTNPDGTVNVTVEFTVPAGYEPSSGNDFINLSLYKDAGEEHLTNLQLVPKGSPPPPVTPNAAQAARDILADASTTLPAYQALIDEITGYETAFENAQKQLQADIATASKTNIPMYARNAAYQNEINDVNAEITARTALVNATGPTGTLATKFAALLTTDLGTPGNQIVKDIFTKNNLDMTSIADITEVAGDLAGDVTITIPTIDSRGPAPVESEVEREGDELLTQFPELATLITDLTNTPDSERAKMFPTWIAYCQARILQVFETHGIQDYLVSKGYQNNELAIEHYYIDVLIAYQH